MNDISPSTVRFSVDRSLNNGSSVNQKSNPLVHIDTFHKFHLVDPSPWPLLASLGAFMLTSGGVMYMHKFVGGWLLMFNGLLLIIFVMYVWWRDVVREATYELQHTVKVQRGLRLGVVLFIVSEVMFFFGFFWAFFHSSLSPVYNIGGVWPPEAIQTISSYLTPLTNTVILLSSGATITWAHHSVVLSAKRHAVVSLIYTLLLAVLFTYFQAIEYVSLPFNISDGIYGSCFYMTTGFHGFHVFVGTIAILVSFIRLVKNHFTTTQHLGLESSIWYWHFVDVVWLFLFISVYWWGNAGANSSTIPPLLNKGKLSALSWALTRISNSEFFIMALYIFISLSLIGASWIIFFLLYCGKNKIRNEINGILRFFFDLPLENKLFLSWFTAFYGIPNRIFVNHNINQYLIFLVVTFLFFMVDELPFITLVLLFYFFSGLESLLIAHLYKNDVYKFQNFVDIYLFGGNREFSKKYFIFFWGNMKKAGEATLKSGAASAAARALWNAITENEDLKCQIEAERRSSAAAHASTKETSAAEVLENTKAEKEALLETKAPFTKMEKRAKEFIAEQATKLGEQAGKWG